jgi:hypothetical protein
MIEVAAVKSRFTFFSKPDYDATFSSLRSSSDRHVIFNSMNQVRGRRIAPYQLPCASSRPVADFRSTLSLHSQLLEQPERRGG